ncbi:hypothetical protein VTN49DRAFT_7709 [Thermomyces lanuginosus]|uniref:uncharacterized protein n=1 Tax=Thermomyces lanuginosus TaxID=5541 RepID=UPI003742E814
MSFRKRNVGLSPGAGRDAPVSSLPQPAATSPPTESLPGVRPSPDDGRPTTSTGSRSLDNLLAGHAGLPMGKILLIEENGTTDFASALLRYYAAEGIVQEHKVHVVGIGEQWGRTLPALIGPADAVDEKVDRRKEERMKIAWRYERLGEFGTGITPARAPVATPESSTSQADAASKQKAFCHAFDLTKRLAHPALSTVDYVPLVPSREPIFVSVLKKLVSSISTCPPNTVHRILIPSLLNPAIYPPDCSQPEHLLQFIHSLRGLLSSSAHHITAMITLPLSLYPRSSGLVRWVELLCDGVIELCPFPHSSDALATSGAATAHEEPPQGMLKTHKLPVLHERGGGSDQNIGEDWAFTLSRRKFEIKPFSLPPAEGDSEAQQAASSSLPKKSDLEF